MKEKVILKCKSGKASVDIQTAELRLRAKRVNPSQTWALDDPGYIFDGKNIIKKKQEPKPKPEDKKTEG